ncbi:MAG TPA: AraC family transcriptional regulator [Clostridiales bacterium]|nr:AraC family transcriptional regulator [Clostridiales bacterium]
MRNFYVLATALDYIENNICNNFSLDVVAKVCSSSLSNLHKLFSYAFGYSIKDYIQRRRHSLACHDLVTTKMSILDIAIKYQYNSHEVFIRAFKKLRGESPSTYRKNHSLPNLYQS